MCFQIYGYCQHFPSNFDNNIPKVEKSEGITFSHAFGIGVLAGEEGMGFGSVYSPRLNIINISKSVTTSIGTHAGIILNTNDGGSQSFIGIELPLMFEINIGSRSHPNNNSNFGTFLGIGYGFSSISRDDPSEVLTTGLFFVFGLRFSDIGVKFSYLENFDENNFGGASIIIQFNIN
ncbi:MAG: hypothetical protein COA31_004475 [Flavobacteriales bacterium]|nr:hypothetical protein [Flavobacteriales bacterium]